MAGITRAAGVPDYSSSGTVGFTPEVWSGKLVEKVYKATVFGEIATTDYEGDIKGMGDNVIIRTVPDVTIADYVIGAGLTAQYPSRASVSLPINKAKSFNVAVSTVDRMQSDLDMADIFANDGSIQLKISADTDMLANIYGSVNASNAGTTAGADEANVNLGTTGAPVSLTSSNVLAWITDMGQVLDEQSVSDEGRWLVLPPWIVNLIKSSDLRVASLAGDGVSIMRNGKVGMVDRFMIYQSRSLAKTTTKTHVVAGHPAGLAFAAQITECESIPNPNDFGMLVRGLMVYGYSVIEPKYVLHSVVTRG